METGNWSTALAALRPVLMQAPNHPVVRNLLGVALLQQGNAEAAVAEFEQAARLARTDPAILANLGQACAAAGRHAEAYRAWRKASQMAPNNLQYAEGTAIALAQQHRLADAAALLQRLTARFPAAASPWYNLGNVRRELGDPAGAEHCYREALARTPQDWAARNNLGSVLHTQLRYAEAEGEYRACIAAQPAEPAAHLNLVSVLIDVGRYEQAEASCRTLLACAPELPQAHRFLAMALRSQGKVAAALPHYVRAVTLAPEDAAARRSHGSALAQMGAVHHALRELAHAARLEPDAAAACLAEISVWLPHGMFADGWAAYRHRPKPAPPKEQPEAAVPVHPVQSLPPDVAGLRIAILPEQGVGDELFFLRYAPLLQARGAQVVVRASAKIAALITRSGCAHQVIAGPGGLPGNTDLQLLCGDLPFALDNRPVCPVNPQSGTWNCRDFLLRIGAWFPPLPPALRIPALPHLQEHMRLYLAAFGPPPYLGVTWRAGTAAREQGDGPWALSKEIPLAALATALRGYRGTLLALQRNPAAGEIDTISRLTGKTLHDCTAVNDDLEAMLALLEWMDDYVGVSNTNMHLRAAAGRTARVLVPQPPEWRWMHAGRESPWFPGFTLYRQSPYGDWRAAVQALAHDLAA